MHNAQNTKHKAQSTKHKSQSTGPLLHRCPLLRSEASEARPPGALCTCGLTAVVQVGGPPPSTPSNHLLSSLLSHSLFEGLASLHLLCQWGDRTGSLSLYSVVLWITTATADRGEEILQDDEWVQRRRSCSSRKGSLSCSVLSTSSSTPGPHHHHHHHHHHHTPPLSSPPSLTSSREESFTVQFYNIDFKFDELIGQWGPALSPSGMFSLEEGRRQYFWTPFFNYANCVNPPTRALHKEYELDQKLVPASLRVTHGQKIE